MSERPENYKILMKGITEDRNKLFIDFVYILVEYWSFYCSLVKIYDQWCFKAVIIK